MKLLLAAGVCGAAILTVSSLSGLQEVSMNMSNKNQTAFAQSTSANTMYTLSVESYQGIWGWCLRQLCSIENNKVPGWKYQYTVKEKTFSCTVWQNNYEDNTYAMILSGTDECLVEDMLTTYFPMMAQEDRCFQLDKTIEETKKMGEKYNKQIDKLYISGYSLGGYLSNYLAMELVDGEQYDSEITVKDIGDNLKIDNVFCYSYAAPGLYAERFKWEEQNANWVPIPQWVQDKLDRNAAGNYEGVIKNYKNNKDPVANVSDIAAANGARLKLKSVGKVYTTDPPASMLEKNIMLKKLINAKMKILGIKINPTHLAYHAPDVYYGSIAKIEAQKQNVV